MPDARRWIGTFDRQHGLSTVDHEVEVTAPTRAEAERLFQEQGFDTTHKLLVVHPDDRGTGDWECYGCGLRRPALDRGFGTRCEACGSYEIHLYTPAGVPSRQARARS